MDDRGDGLNVGFLSTRLAGTDGVSLEAAKIAELLKRRGHSVAYCAGELESGGPPGRLAPEMHFAHPEIRAIHDAAFLGRPIKDLRQRIGASAERLRAEIRSFVADFGIDLLIPQNVLAIPMNLSLGLAVANELAATGIPAIAHHHDFAWERPRFAGCEVSGILKTAFPPSLPTLRHAVISTVAQSELRARCGIASVVLPNVLDFSRGPLPRTLRRVRVRERLGIGPDDLVLLQPTRVVPRKGIEHSIALARGISERFRNTMIRLVVSHDAGDEGMAYLERLQDLANAADIDLIMACDHFVSCEVRGDPAPEVFDLRDAYECCDLVTYPSLIEGFGNAFLEAIFYRRPLLVNRYPVYAADIEPCGFDVIAIDGRVEDRTVDAVVGLLGDERRIRDMTDHNFRVARRHFSYEVAGERLGQLLEGLES